MEYRPGHVFVLRAFLLVLVCMSIATIGQCESRLPIDGVNSTVQPENQKPVSDNQETEGSTRKTKQTSRDRGRSDSDPFESLKVELRKTWPDNRRIRFVFHGHSVPAGYFKTPTVRRFDSYPTLFHQALCDKFSTATIDVCTTAIGGENSNAGAARFTEDVLSLRPDVVFIDYCLNDRRIGVAAAEANWRSMIDAATNRGVIVVLMTPTPDARENILDSNAKLAQHSNSIRSLAKQYGLPIVDSYRAFEALAESGKDIKTYLSQVNHPNRKGHEIVSGLMMELFDRTLKRGNTNL